MVAAIKKLNPAKKNENISYRFKGFYREKLN
jgi:hypothetical protein